MIPENTNKWHFEIIQISYVSRQYKAHQDTHRRKNQLRLYCYWGPPG